MGGTPEFLWWGDARVTPWMHYELSRLDGDLRKNFGVGLVANSGIRLALEQKDIFLRRYVTAGNVNGRKVYDTRWWNGQLWYRISSAGTVAVPGTSNHEIQGSKAAVDIADTGQDAGITSKNSTRGRWLRANAWRYSLIASGDGFREGWHFDMINIWNTPPTTPGTTQEEELDMNVQIVLHTPTNQLLLVDHLNRTIRNLGNSATDPVRDFYSRKPYTKMDDKVWAAATKGYQYITLPTAWETSIPARDAAGSPIKGAAFPAAVYLAAMDAKINKLVAEMGELRKAQDDTPAAE